MDPYHLELTLQQRHRETAGYPIILLLYFLNGKSFFEKFTRIKKAKEENFYGQ